MIRFLVILALAALAAAPAPALATSGETAAGVAERAATTVILVRHAEKDTMRVGADQPLNAAGMLRAKELARVLGDVDFDAIYVTPWARSRQTAEPLARRRGDSLIVVDPIDETIRRLRLHRGQTVLVVGHSNTVPQIISGLMGEAAPDSIVAGYDDLYVLTLIPDQPSRLVHLHYGAVPKRSH